MTWSNAIKQLQSRKQQNPCPPISNSGLSPTLQGRADSNHAGEDGIQLWDAADPKDAEMPVRGWGLYVEMASPSISNATTCIHSAWVCGCHFSFYCCIENYCKSIRLEHSRLLAHSSADERSRPSMTGFSSQDLKGWNSDIGWAVFSSGGSTREESTSEFIQVVGRIQLLMAIGSRPLLSCWW